MKRLIARLRAGSDLSRDERADLRRRLLAQTGMTETAPNYFVNMLPYYARVAALSLALLVVIGSPFAIAAEKSEPGDILYPVKKTVNEPIKKVAKTIFPKKTEPAVPEVREEVRATMGGTDDRDDSDDKNRGKKNRGTQNPLSGTKTGADIPIIPGVVEETIPSVQKTVDDITDTVPLLKDEEKKEKKEEKNREDSQDEDEDEPSTAEEAADAVEETVKRIGNGAKHASDEIRDSVGDTLGL